MNDRPREKLRLLAEALEDEAPDDEEAREVVAALGVDIPSLAARIRARAAAVAARPTTPALASFASLQQVARRRSRDARDVRGSHVRSRAEQIDRIRALTARLDARGGAGVAAHFRKLEDAGDEELAAILTALQDLIDADE